MRQERISDLRLVVVGQTPPPYNGQAKMIKIMLDALSAHYDVRFVRMDFSDSVAKAGKFSVHKISHLFSLVFRTLRALGWGRQRYLYYPPASPKLIPVLRDILFLLMVRPFAKGLILHFHAGGVSRFAERHSILRFFLMAAYGRMALGMVNGNSCPDDPGYFKAKVKAIVPHGIDVERCSLAVNTKGFVGLKILYVGIHTEEKGLFTLLETAKLLKQRGVGFEMHTVGQWYTQTEEDRFVQRLDESGLTECVICVGQKTGDDLWQEYAWADVFFFPTKYPWETMGIVQLEAMASGIPVVASDWQGPKDVVVEGQTGFLCPVEDVSAFADRLQRLANERELRERMGAAGRRRYETCYTVDAYMDRLVAVFDPLT